MTSRSLVEKILSALRDVVEIEEGKLQDFDEAPFLTDWIVVQDEEGVSLLGIVYGHPRLRDGASVQTSALIAIATDLSWARTLNTLYRLARPKSTLH